MSPNWTITLLATLAHVAGSVDEEKPEVILHGEGASFPNIIYRSWMKSYVVARKTQDRGRRIIEMTYSPFSSGRGKEYMVNKNKDIDFGGSDSELSEAQYKLNPSLKMIPTLAGPIVIGYKLPNVTMLKICRECLVGIYNGSITKWNHPLLEKENPDQDLPAEPIKVVARKESSGTTAVMTLTLASFSKQWETHYGVFSGGQEKGNWNKKAVHYSFRHYGMVDELEHDYTIAYLPLDVADTYKVNYAQLQNKAGKYIGPTSAGVEAAMNNAWMNRTPQQIKRLTASLPDSEGAEAYPMASFTYIILNIEEMTCHKAVELARFVHWVYNDPAADEKDGFISTSAAIGERVQKEIFSLWTCGPDKKNVKALLDIQLKREEPVASWVIPVSISVPLFALLVFLFTFYLAYQRYKINKIMNRTDWDIEIEDIAFYPPKSFKETTFSDKKRNIRASFMSGKHSVSTSDSLEVPVSQVLHWPGKWKARTIGLRILQVPHLEQHVDRDIQRTLVWMRDSVLHDNVVRFYGLTTLDTERFIISDYCHKGTLSEILRDSKLNMNENLKMSIAFDVASGMTFLHSLGVVHGLLRAATCVIDSRWTVKVADWEFYKLHTKVQMSKPPNQKSEFKFTSSTDLQKQLKNSYYFAPEILRANVAVEPTVYTDVYNYAVVVQEIFTRKEPYFEIADILSPKEIVEAIKVNSIRPVHSDLTPLKVKQIMEIAWADDPTSRPSFDQVLKMLKNAHPGRKSVLDHMIDVMDEYSHTLEAKVDEKTKELDLTRKQFNDLLLTFLPQYATEQLMDGQTVNPVNLTKAALMEVKINGFGSDLTELDTEESSRLMAEAINLVDEKASNHDLVKVSRDHSRMIFIGNLDNEQYTKGAVAMATMAIELFPAFKEWGEMSKWTSVGLKVTMHIGKALILVLDTKVPMLAVLGDGVEELKSMQWKSRENCVLASREAYRCLAMERNFELTRNEYDQESETYWLKLPERTISDVDNQSESGSSMTSRKRSNFNSPTLRASLRRLKELKRDSNHLRPDSARSRSRSPGSQSNKSSRSRKSRSRSPETEIQQTTSLLLSEPSSPETQQRNESRDTKIDNPNDRRHQNGGTNISKVNKEEDEKSEMMRKREEILNRHRKLAGGAFRAPSPEDSEEGVPGLAEIFIMC